MIDRSKYRSAPIQELKNLDSEMGQRRGFAKSFDRGDYHSIDSGDNKFRIYPAHLSSKSPIFWRPKSVSWLTVWVDKYDENNKKTGEKEQKRRPVFNSDIHGPRELSNVDLIKAYIDYAKKRIEELYEGEAEQKAAKDLLYNWKTGLSPKMSWVMYADKYDNKGQKKLGILEISNSIKKQFNELASQSEGQQDVVSTDPFTDPNEGISVIISKTGEKLDTKYKVELESVRKGKFALEYVPTPLEDEDLEKMEKFESLENLFSNNFTVRHFEMQLDGLNHFDEEFQFGFLAEDEFIVKMEEIKDLVLKYAKKTESKEDVNEEEEEVVEKKQTSTPTPRRSASVKQVESKKEEDPEEEEDEEEEPQTKPIRREVPRQEESPEKTTSTAERLAAIRAKLQK
jgi:hypothetical protein